MEPEDKIKGRGGIISRVWKRRVEISILVFFITFIIVSLLYEFRPDDPDRFGPPAIMYGVAWGFGSGVACFVTFLSWWLWVALFEMEE